MADQSILKSTVLPASPMPLFNSFSQSQISLAVRHGKKLIQCEMYSIFWQLVFQWHDHDLKRKVWMYVLYAKRVSSSNQESEIMMLTLQSCDQESQMPHHEPKESSKTKANMCWRNSCKKCKTKYDEWTKYTDASCSHKIGVDMRVAAGKMVVKGSASCGYPLGSAR